jgi:sensor domain CHASE-containing protein
MLHHTSMTFVVLVVILLGAFAAEYRMEQSEIPIEAKNIVSSFRTKLEDTKVIKSDIQVMSFLMSIIKQMVLDLDREQQQIEKENALFRGSRE